MKSQRIGLIGCGQLGTELGQRLLARGAQVLAVRRDTAGLPTGFTGLSWDITQPGRLPTVDALVITLTPTMPEVHGEPGYLVALQQLAEALPNTPSRVIFVSSTRVFEGHETDRMLTENDPVAPVTDRGRLLVAAEQLAAELFNAHIVRPAGIYGPGREWLLRTVRQQKPVDHARRTNRIHQTDLARGLEALLAHPAPPALLHAVDDAAGVPLGDVVGQLAQRLGVPVPQDSGTGQASGRRMSGQRFHALIGQLYYPTFRQGYDQVIAEKTT